MLNKFLSILLIALLMPTGVWSQHQISGIITDSQNKESLPGAHIYLKNTKIQTISNLQGQFLLENIPTGHYELNVSYLGYKTSQQLINLQKDQYLTIELNRQAIMEDAVIIRATRADRETPATYSNIDKRSLQQENLGQDLPFLIARTPSIITTSDAGTGVGYTGMRIRGTDMSRINVTVNGIPFNDAESHNVFWVDIPDFAASVDNMQIQRGVGTSTNGAAAFGASINIQTTTMNAKPYAVIDNAMGSFNTRKHSIAAGTGLIKNKFTIDARLSRVASDGYIDRATSDLKSYFVSAGYYGNRSLLKFNIFAGDEVTYQAWDGIPSTILDTNRTYNPSGAIEDSDGHIIGFYNDHTDNYQQNHYQAIYSYRILEGLHLNSALHYTHGEGYYESYKNNEKLNDYGSNNFITDPGIEKSNLIRRKWLDNDFYGATFSLNYELANRLKTTIGGAWNRYEGDHFGKIIWAQNAIVKDKDANYYFNEGTKTDFTVFGKINYTITNNINAYVDLQYRQIEYDLKGVHDNLIDVTQNHSYQFFNPKAGVTYSWNSHFRSYLALGIANREPNRRSFVDAGDGRIPENETLYNMELGTHYAEDDLQLGVNLYSMVYNNQLVLTGKINNVGDPILMNVEDSYRAGIEITAAYQITKPLSWNFNITLSQNKILDFVSHTDDWDTWPEQRIDSLGTTDISFSPNVILNNTFIYQPLKKLDIQFSSKYVGDQFIDNTSNQDRKLDAYFVNDLRATYKLSLAHFPEILFNLSVNNIFGEEYETNAWIYRYYSNDIESVMDGYFPQAGRNFMAGITLKF